MTVGERIKALRVDKHISQEELADLINVSRQTISKWEQDSVVPDSNNILLLCNYFNVSADYILNGCTSTTRNNQDNFHSNRLPFIISIAVLCVGVGLLLYCIISISINYDYYNSMEFKISSGTSNARIPAEYFLSFIAVFIIIIDLIVFFRFYYKKK